MAVACQDEAGPYQTVPYAGPQWAPVGRPPRQPHEYVRLGTAKLLTLFRPATGRLQAQGVSTCPNAVLHPWLKAAVRAVLATLPEPAPVVDAQANQASWSRCWLNCQRSRSLRQSAHRWPAGRPGKASPVQRCHSCG